MATLNNLPAKVEMIAFLDPGILVIADAPTGYGEPTVGNKAVTQYARAQIAALHIQDQVGEKDFGTRRLWIKIQYTSA